MIVIDACNNRSSVLVAVLVLVLVGEEQRRAEWRL